MNTFAAVVWRDRALAVAITLILVALLFGFSSPLPLDFTPPPPAPPVFTFRPQAMAPDHYAEYYDEWHAAYSPALFALSAPVMLPATSTLGGLVLRSEGLLRRVASAKGGKRVEAGLLSPPLEAGYPLHVAPYRPEPKDDERLPAGFDAPRAVAILAPRPGAGPALAPPRKLLPPPAYRVDLAGELRGREVDLSPMFTLEEPAEPWSFSAALSYDATGQVRHALLESAALEPSLRAEVVRRLYQCRVRPAGTPGEGRLTLSGPGSSARQ
ncbi:MAG: hypothetical protein HYV35_09810 [Lentisphaerae bacterium]|nr:hypothetical protein [Lentisphaerota bacterium]